MISVSIEGRRVDLDPGQVLGVGGEATVYRHDTLAVKIYHGVDKSLPRDQQDAARRLLELRFEKLQAFPPLGPEVVAPKAIVQDRRKRPIGYAMPIVHGGFEIARLAKRRHREGLIDNARVMRIFGRLADILEALHRAGVVVGDLNDGNVLVVGDDVRLIDVDSMQFGRWPCPVAHERFLDPSLYGVDLSAAPRFSPANDWYAFCVLLFSTLLYVHPFGGVHPSIATFLRRAAAGASLLSAIVKRPKSAADPAVLPDALKDVFLATFERGARGPVPVGLFAVRWSRCPCGTEHAHAVCPLCLSSGTVSPRPVVRNHGRCRVTDVFETTGRILVARVQGKLRWLESRDGWLYRDGHRALDAQDPGPTARYGVEYDTTWIGLGDRLVHAGPNGLGRAPCGTFEGESAFAASSAGVTRVDGDHLVDHATGLRIGPIVPGTTWIAQGAELGFGFYRVGLVTKSFVFRPGRAGLVFVDLPSITGRVRYADAVFDANTVAVSLVTEESGRIRSRLHVLRADGQVLGTLDGRPDSNRVLAAPGGRVVMGGRVLTATEDGLVLLSVAQGVVAEDTCFTDTEPFVAADTRLLLAPGGAVFAVGHRTIKELALT